MESSSMALDMPIAAALSLLPDPNEELYVQDSGPKTFLRFPSLPLELRFRIWQLNFPLAKQLWVAHDTKKHMGPHCYSPTPTLLHVNQESRAEILRCYKPLIPQSKKNDNKPIYFNPKRDEIFFRNFNPLETGKMLVECFFDGHGWIDSIQFLVLRDMDAGQIAEAALTKGYCANVGGEMGLQNKTTCRLPILFFRRLKSLVLILKREYNYMSYNERDPLEKLVVECYERQHIQDTESCVPWVGVWFHHDRHYDW